MMRMRTIAMLATGLAGLCSGVAEAGPLLIAPTTVQLNPGRRSGAIEITNESDAPVDLQFRAFSWDQLDGKERLTPTQALAISPPIATLPPHGKQVFRVLDLGTPDDGAEHSYRLKLNELPRGPRDSVAINLEFSLPVFRTPSGAAPQLASSLAGQTEVRIANHGNRRLRIAEAVLHQPDGSKVALANASSVYILTNSSRSFALPKGTIVNPGAHVHVTTDTGPIDVPLATLAAR